MGNRRDYDTAHEGAPTPGPGGSSDSDLPISIVRRLYLAAQRSGYGREYLASLRAHLRHEAGNPVSVRRQLIQAFGQEAFPFSEIDPDWHARVQTLRRAFGERPYPYHDDAAIDAATPREAPERWMIDMPLFSADICRYVLPRVMADLLTVSPDEFRCTDLVVQYLDVEGDHRPENLKDVVPMVEKLVGEGHGAQWVLEYNAEADHRRAGKLAHFSTFTEAQRAAVLAWLKLARTWPECTIVSDNVASAIEYWSRKIGSTA